MVDELKYGMICIHRTLTCTMTSETMALAFPPVEDALVSRVASLLNDMSGQNITPQLYNTEIGHLLRRVGQGIKAG